MSFAPRRPTIGTGVWFARCGGVKSLDWRHGLPTLIGSRATLQEPRIADAPTLFRAMSVEDVSRFISRPPSTVEGFEKFIEWTERQRAAGQYVCFAVIPHSSERAIGLFQIRSLMTGFSTAEWGFALARQYWGTGLFVEGAALAVNFAFDVLGTRRLEARAALKNDRGNGALRKLGAIPEGVLRRSLRRNGEYLDQALWTLPTILRQRPAIPSRSLPSLDETPISRYR